jgi:hypothetical protein
MRRTLIVLAGVSLYVLSVGPAFQSEIGIVHRPLYLLARNRIPGWLLASYINLWLPRNDRATWDPRMGVFVIEGNSLDSQ